MILNKTVAMALWASPLAVFGIDMDLPSFMAGMFFSLPAYYFGRQIWKEHGNLSFWMGLGMAMFAAMVVAAAPNIIPIDIPVQVKMALVSLGITLIVARAEKKGKDWVDE